MEFTIKTKELVRECRLANAVVQKSAGKKKIPVLDNLRLGVVGKRLTITKSDLDVWMAIDLDVTHAKRGACLVNARLLRDLAATVTDEELTCKFADNRLSVTAGKASWSLGASPATDYPDIPKFPQRQLDIPMDTFRAHLARVMFAVTDSQSRFTLSGVKFIVNGSMTLVATDGHRLAVTSTPEVTGNADTLLPLRLLRLLAKFPKVDVMGFALTDFLFFDCGSHRLIGRPLSGTFPKYESVIPKDNPLSASFDAIAMTAALRQALVAANSRHRQVKWVLNPDGLSDLSTNDYDREFNTQVVTNYKGDMFAFSVNGEYLLDFCSRQSGVVDMTAKDPNAQIEFKIGDDYKYIVMPMRG